MNGLFLYDYPHLYPKRTRHYTKCTKSSFLEYLMKIPKRRSTSSPKSTYFCPSKQCQSDNMINLIVPLNRMLTQRKIHTHGGGWP